MRIQALQAACPEVKMEVDDKRIRRKVRPAVTYSAAHLRWFCASFANFTKSALASFALLVIFWSLT